ncbi:universal stress protein [Azospirillum baldaniorum]|uniref:Universal stress protein, UspA-like n=1 Tax=Azospirillum baldaniorum TaxID=1064539 RepID=A0A9P1JN56_9PROT|nr:universal stress protein [Azospirillum baldaniorum]TWA79963.1 universal stress protein family protein [Azospirillum brasilense]AWJ88516.1 universal stress protein [Azospirillum baldaniorum]NUB10049.1 universal stress protein [Azospirillum baldaniorum]TWA68530.1 universal stress protein family protein [Azospirillum baldaniorum]CCC96554.1 putative universal stress protein, UspA-like [Azospirillum baldaniorum]
MSDPIATDPIATDPNAGADVTPEATAKPPVRIFLVVVDESPELQLALRYACLRARKSGGKVALLYVIEPGEVQQWLALENLMREEQRAEAEQKLQKLARDVNRLTGTLPALYVREGNRRDEVLALIDEEPSISILVLAAGVEPEGPGPLISYFTNRGLAKMRIPLTIVPGGIGIDALDAIT